MTNDPDQQRAMALQDAHRLLRQAQAAIAASASTEPAAHRRDDLARLHALVSDAQEQAARLKM